LTDELQLALFDFQRYLLDQIPPLTASEAVETLMAHPPELLVKQIHAWSIEQSRHQEASQSDFLFHALKKVYLFSILKLVDRPIVESYLDGLLPPTLQICPPGERDALRSSIAAMRESQILGGNTSSGVVPISRTGAGEAKARSASAGGSVRDAVNEVVTRSARRLSMVVERLTRRGESLPAAEPADLPREVQEHRQQQQAQLVSMAAASATSERELAEYVRTLGVLAGGTQPEQLLHVLAADVPRWDIAVPSDAKQPAAIEAMHKIISLTSNSIDSGKRFRELMTEAVEQFNSGALGPAVAMLELAERVLVEKKMDPSTVERVRNMAVESISAERLRKYSENKTKHVLLRQALNYFPTLRKESLLQELRGEERPERRRALLGLLEAFGSEARATALAELALELNRPTVDLETYYLRNVIYLLHRIPRDSEESVDKELELLTRATARGQNIYVIKEAVLPLGHMRSAAAAKVLTTRLAELEVMLVRKDISLYPMDEMQKVIDRIIAALARIGTPAALLTIARHGMKPNPLLGDTRARLAALSQHDLSFDEQTVDILVKAIRDDLPTKLLGRIMPSRQPPPVRLIEALSGTRAEKVESLFSELAEKFPDHDVGRAAAAALYNLANTATVATRQTVAATLTGDLDFFGLPSLLQSLADQQATGIVTLTARRTGHTSGKLLFLKGKFVDAQTGHLRGVDALYQMLECPATGTFAFVPQPEGAKPKNDPMDVMGLLFEGIRRHDEFRQLMLFVPDDITLKGTGVKPSPDPEETDPAFIRDVWVKASSGSRLGDWESMIAADPFRVRRLVARWLEEGSLQPAV
jgi:hypothetical protein